MQVKASVGGDFEITLSVNETRALSKAMGIVQMLKRADSDSRLAGQIEEAEQLLETLIEVYGAKAKESTVASGE